MNDYTHRQGLYRWKNQNEDKRLYSRSQKVTTNDDIQNWLEKVEAASENATAEVLGLNNNAGGRQNRKQVAKVTAAYAKQNEEAYNEAQDLLSEWMNEKLNISYDLEDDSYDEYLKQREVETKVKQEWDHLAHLNYEDIEKELLSKQGIKTKSYDPYDKIASMPEDKAVSTIINSMLDKEFVKKDFINDLGLNNEKTDKDPRLKMELRRQQVKDNREKRERELNERRRAIQQKKEAHTKAKQIVLNEEREKQSKAKLQEMEIKKEMAKIRKEMQEEKRKREEDIQRKRDEKEKLQRLAQEEFSKQKEQEEQEEMLKQLKAEEKKKIFMMKLEKLQSKQAVTHLKILQRHFAAWYQIVLERRLEMGKARAMSDWKLLLRAFNAWKSYVRNNTVNRETREHEMGIIVAHRNTQTAEKHYKKSLLQKYLNIWQLWVKQAQERRELEINQENTRKKMMALLNAAAKLQDDKKCGEDGKAAETSINLSSVQNDIDYMFDQTDKKRNNFKMPVDSARSDISLLSETGRSSRPSVPREAWQVTKKHLNLTKEEIASLGDGDSSDIGSQSDRKIRARFGTQPWMNKHYVASNYENRHSAQKKILKQQQEQLKEQQRLIEELHFQQRTFMFSDQLQKQKIMQKQIENNMKNLQTMQNDDSEIKVQNIEDTTESERSDPSSHTELTLDLNVGEKGDKPSMSTSRSNSQSERTQSSTTARSGYSASSTKYVQALKSMEERSAERARLKAEREAKRKQAEEERLAQLVAEEEARKQKDIEEKKARIEAHKEKKRLEKQREIEKQEYMEKMKRLNSMADAHYLKSILKYRGIVRFKKLVTISKNNEQKSEHHYKHCLLRKIILSWHKEVRKEMEEKEQLAEEMNCFLLRKRAFNNWRKYKFHIAIEEEKAKKYYERKLLSKYIQTWADYAIEEKLAYWEKEKKAVEFYPVYLKRICFTAWKKYPEYIKLEQEKEKRRIELRKKVTDLLPDFEAVSSSRKSQDFL